MTNRQIVLADSHLDNVRILRENFENAGYQVFVAINCEEAVERIKTFQPDLLLSEYILPDGDGAHLIAKLAEDPVTARTPIIFLSKQGDLATRLRGLKLGAKDYLIKPMHVKEVLARVKLVISRLERLEIEETESNAILSGRLDDASVLDLIEHIVREKKTGILKLRNGHGREGQIFFQNGMVINAMTSSLRREEAVFEMLFWKQGRFSILFQQIDIATEVHLSTLGLLLEGSRRIAEWDRLAHQIPGFTSKLSVTANFKQILGKREITSELGKFISLFDGKCTVNEIIQKSDFDSLTALERIVKLYRQGFLEQIAEGGYRPEEDSERVAASVVTIEPDVEAEPEQIEEGSIGGGPLAVIKERAQESERKEAQLRPSQDTLERRVVSPIAAGVPKPTSKPSFFPQRGILFIGSVQGGRKTVINTITNGDFRVKTLRGLDNISIDRGSTQLADGTIVQIFGIEADTRLSALSEIVATELSGYVVIIDGLNRELFEYYSYLLSSLRDNLQLPLRIAVVNHNVKSLEQLQRKLPLESPDQLVPCDPFERRSIISIVTQLIKLKSRHKAPDMKRVPQ